MLRMIEDLDPVGFLSKVSASIISQTTQMASGFYNTVRNLSDVHEELLWVKAEKRAEVTEYQAWCTAIKKEFQEIADKLNQEVDHQRFREALLKAQEGFQDSIYSPWHYSEGLKWLERKCEGKGLPSVYGDICREAYLVLQQELKHSANHSTFCFYRDLIHTVIKSSKNTIRPMEHSSVLQYYQGLVSEEAHQAASKQLNSLLNNKPDEDSIGLTMFQGKSTWQQECKRTSIALNNLFEPLVEQNDPPKSAINEASSSVLQGLYSGAKKGLEYVKTHPAQAIALSLMAGAAVRYRDGVLGMNTPIHQYTNTPIHQYTNTPIHQYTNTPIHQYTNIPIHQ